jgi:hypothetical protein
MVMMPKKYEENRYYSGSGSGSGCGRESRYRTILFAVQGVKNRVADPHCFNADPYPAFHLNVYPDPTSQFIANPESVPAPHLKVMKVCDH